MDKIYEITRAARAIEVIPRVVFVGDSKGGVHAQAMLASYIRSRDDFPIAMKEVGLIYDPSSFVPNNNLALVAHSSPGGIEPIKAMGCDVDPKRYSEIEMHYSFAYNNFYPEVISAFGSGYLGVGQGNSKARVVKYKTKYKSLVAMHRLGVSGYDYFRKGNDFSNMEPTFKPVLLGKTQNLANFLMAVKDFVSTETVKK